MVSGAPGSSGSTGAREQVGQRRALHGSRLAVGLLLTFPTWFKAGEDILVTVHVGGLAFLPPWAGVRPAWAALLHSGTPGLAEGLGSLGRAHRLWSGVLGPSVTDAGDEMTRQWGLSAGQWPCRLLHSHWTGRGGVTARMISLDLGTMVPGPAQTRCRAWHPARGCPGEARCSPRSGVLASRGCPVTSHRAGHLATPLYPGRPHPCAPGGQGGHDLREDL